VHLTMLDKEVSLPMPEESLLTLCWADLLCCLPLDTSSFLEFVMGLQANGVNGSSAPGAPALEGNPLFNSQFMSVLQTSLARQGADALLANTRPEEPR